MKSQRNNLKVARTRKLATAGWTLIALTLFAGCGKGEIELTEEEKAIAALSAGSAVFRDATGAIKMLKPAEVINYAASKGFSAAAATDSQKIAQQTGAVLGFTETGEGMGQTFSDMLAHIKGKLNTSNQDLEVAFTLDYSGSMSDDIKAVVNGMVEITRSLQKVQEAGRGVRIGIVTFGKQGREKVDLDLTPDLDTVKVKLQELLDQYSGGSHSDDPGEASYAALNLVANKLAWQATQRFSIVVTDEGSKELQSTRAEDAALVKKVNGDLKANGVESSVYTIVVR